MILQSPADPSRVLGELAALLADPAVERLRAAVAYANPAGVDALHALLAARENDVDVEIVVTLDMGITRKAALEALLNGHGDVKVIETGSAPGTFHAKVFAVDRDGAPPRAIVGSANLTFAALTQNYEGISVDDLSQEDAAGLEQWWQELWQAAEDLTPEVIAGYSERKPPPGRKEKIADEDVETDGDGSPVVPIRPSSSAASADWLLIDWGGTGEYRVQAELPQGPAAFFKPAATGERSIAISHAGSEYADNQLRYYPDNGMVRINLDPEIPVVADGSIKSQAAVFTRLGTDHYGLELADETGRAARLAEATHGGEVGHTTRNNGTHRRYGWGGNS